MDPAGADEVEAARRPYTTNESNSHDANSYNQMLPQMSRRGPRMAHPRRHQHPTRSYPLALPGAGNARHAAIGALIGGGLGVSMSLAGNTDRHAKGAAALIFGGFGAAFGALVGATFPSHNWRNHLRPWQDEDDVASNSHPDRGEQGAAPRAVAPEMPVKDGAAATESREIPEHAQIIDKGEPSQPGEASHIAGGGGFQR